MQIVTIGTVNGAELPGVYEVGSVMVSGPAVPAAVRRPTNAGIGIDDDEPWEEPNTTRTELLDCARPGGGVLRGAGTVESWTRPDVGRAFGAIERVEPPGSAIVPPWDEVIVWVTLSIAPFGVGIGVGEGVGVATGPEPPPGTRPPLLLPPPPPHAARDSTKSALSQRADFNDTRILDF